MRLNKSFIFLIILLALFSTIVFAQTDNFNLGPDLRREGPDLRQEVNELKVKVSELENRLHTVEQQMQPRLIPLNKD